MLQDNKRPIHNGSGRLGLRWRSSAYRQMHIPARRAALLPRAVRLGAFLLLISVCAQLGGNAAPAQETVTAAPLMEAYEVRVDGRLMGIVADGGAARALYEAGLSGAADGADALTVTPVSLPERPLRDAADIAHAALSLLSSKVTATGIYVDGALCAVVDTDETAEALLLEALEPFIALEKSRDIADVGFVEDVQIMPVKTTPDAILPKEEALSRLMRGGVKQQPYTVVQGDTIIQIAERSGLSRAALRAANPSIIGNDMIRVGDVLDTAALQGVLHVTFAETLQRTEAIAFETTVKESSKYKTGTTRTETAGKDGQREVTRRMVFAAGYTARNTLLSERVLSNPVDEVLVKGTAQSASAGASSASASGFVWPVRGRISSRFGARWESQHLGLDIAASSGTPIVAAKAGKVIFSGVKSGYGNVIYIDHGGDVITRYGHCSKLLVKKGATVKQGERIALVGSTGKSTGPHLHFEIRIDGTAVNPEKRLP